jgi:hypothetical protein
VPEILMPRPGLVQVFAFAVFSLALAQVMILWPAAAGLPLLRPLAWAIIAMSLAAAAWLAARLGGAAVAAAAPANGSATARPPAQGVAPAALAAGWLAALAGLAFAAWLWAGLWRLAWARPVYDWDGLYYHLPAMNAWAAAGRVHWITGIDDLPFANGYPMAVEALGFLVHRASGSSRLLDGGNLFHWPLAALALAVIAARLGARGSWRFVPAGLLAAVPGWVILSTTCYVDPGFAAAAMAALAAMLLYAGAADAHAARLALLFGAAGGLMIGAKGQGLGFFAVAFAAALLTRWARPARSSAPLIAHAALVALAAFLVGGYWMLRNVVWSGNPIFPVEWKLGAKVIAAGYDTGALLDGNMPAWLRAWPAWLRVPIAWLQPDAPIRGYAATGGLGILWIGAGLPALALAWVMAWRARRAPMALLLLTAVGAAWLAIQPAPWWARMTLWLHALGLPALAFVLDALARARRPTAAFAAPLVLLALLAAGASESVGAFEGLNGRRLAGTGRDAYVSSAEFIFPGLERACPDFLAARRIARGPWSRFGTLLGGVLAQPLDARSIEPLAGAGTARLRTLRDAGIEWVVWDESLAPPPAEVREAAIDSCAYRPHPAQRFIMLRMHGSPERPDISRR